MDRIAVAGGNGTLGRAILRELADCGYETVNCSRGDREEDAADRYQRVDLEDAGEVYGALAGTDVDAVVHVGTIPSPKRTPGHVTYRNNVQTAYAILEASQHLGVERVVLPSSVNVLGATFQDAPVSVDYLPIDEAHPVRPRDPYGVAKHAMEVTADGVARRADAPSIASLRYTWVADDDQLRERFDGHVDEVAAFAGEWAPGTRDVLFSYLHLDDAATVARRAVEADFDGHHRVWAAAEDSSVDVPTERLVERFFPDADLRADLSGDDGLIDCSRARELLDWSPSYSWRSL